MTTPDSVIRYPLALDLRDRRVLVVGGGTVATRRTRDLIAAGARVHVVTPWASDELWAMVNAGQAQMTLREFQDGDHGGAWLVHTCTGVAAVDAEVVAVCEASRVWCIRASDAASSPAWSAASVTHDDVTVTVTANADPRRAVALRDAIAALLRDGSLPLNPGRSTPGRGWVALVGGGPGAADLITVRGRTLLAQADVVVIDRLAPRELLDGLPSHVDVVDAGKGPDAHTLTQEQINALIVERALAGHRVVRLKGGDPFVLGRGGEEVLACAEAGVPVEVVPGITSAIAVAGAAGIPVTHRGLATQFTVISAHDRIGEVLDHAPADGTLVLLMGVGRLAAITEGLLARGRSPKTPVAIVERGTTPQQRVTTGDLSTILVHASKCHVESPAVIVVGDVVPLVGPIGEALTKVIP
jgi:uroporphyrin-III C-methyltransferase/precorrin-2 dehydrogenase/sirohydrochlorin ferrochelatase